MMPNYKYKPGDTVFCNFASVNRPITIIDYHEWRHNEPAYTVRIDWDDRSTHYMMEEVYLPYIIKHHITPMLLPDELFEI